MDRERPCFAVRLRQLRQRKRVTQQVVADFCVVSVATINRYETGRQQPTGDVLLRMSDYFECSVDYLLGHDLR